MEIIIHNSVAEIVADGCIIHQAEDILDIIGNARYQGAESIILYEAQLPPAFFDLKTGLAGEILQKFSNYHTRLAIVGDFKHYDSKSLRDFIYESNKTGRINFVSDIEAAKQKLAQ